MGNLIILPFVPFVTRSEGITGGVTRPVLSFCMEVTMSPIRRKMLVVSLEQAVTVVEKMIDAARDQDVRDQLVVRLARLDQYLAALRDRP